MTPDPKERAVDLLACPFCGADLTADDTSIEWPDWGDLGKRCVVRCCMCGAATYGHVSEDQAIAAWNRRTKPQPDAGRGSGVTDRMAEAFWRVLGYGDHKHWPVPLEQTKRCLEAALAARTDGGGGEAWVKCSERMPEPCGRYASASVLGIDEYGCMRVRWIGTDGNGGWIWHPSELYPPTHWQPLPAPPLPTAPASSGEGG